MKYCIYRDQPLPYLASGKQDLKGCKILGVWHDCEKCPSLKEMSDNPQNELKDDTERGH